MKIFKLTASLVVTSLFLVVNSYALPTAGDTVTFTSTISGFSGGPFDATVTDADHNSVTNYITFCLEKREYINFSDTFTVSNIAEYAESGGINSDSSTPGKDYISDATKWVYWNYLHDSFDSTGLTNRQLGIAIQESVWMLEDEINEFEYDGSKEFFKNVVLTQADYSIAGDVQVMNLVWTENYGNISAGDFAQSQLVAAPVPEPSTMLLFGTGIAGLASIARRRRK